MDDQLYTAQTQAQAQAAAVDPVYEAHDAGLSSATGRDIASLVLGVLSLYLAVMVPIVGHVIGLILAIIGAVLGVRGRRDIRLNNKGVATAGLICSAIGIVLCAILLIATIVMVVLTGMAFAEAAGSLPYLVDAIYYQAG